MNFSKGKILPLIFVVKIFPWTLVLQHMIVSWTGSGTTEKIQTSCSEILKWGRNNLKDHILVQGCYKGILKQ